MNELTKFVRYFIFAVIILIVFVLIGEHKKEVPASASAQTTVAIPAPPPSPPPAPKPGAQWNYPRYEDKMGKGTNYTAVVYSTNTVEFDAPYSGPQNAKLTLRTHPRYGKDIIFRIERGQLLCSAYDGCSVLVRFDDKNAQTFSASGAEDSSTETLFIQDYSRFVGSMLKAKRVRIAANIYQEGAPVFEFDVSGFDAAKYKPK